MTITNVVNRSMYDYAKIVINNQAFVRDLLDNILLNFETPVNIKTGEIMEQGQTARYRNLTFKVYPSGRVEINGSLHKYWNAGEHNYNDFNLQAVRSTIVELQQKFNVDPELAQIHHLEIGMNIITPFKPNDFLKSLIAFKNRSFNRMKLESAGFGKDVDFQQFRFKLYNKGQQFSRAENLLRVEKKYSKMICLGKGNVFVNDLVKLDFASHCIKELLKCFDEIIVEEPVNDALLSRNQKKIYEICINPRQWETMTRKQRYKYKNQYADIVQTFSKQHYKSIVQELLINKGNELKNCF